MWVLCYVGCSVVLIPFIDDSPGILGNKISQPITNCNRKYSY